MYRDCNHVNINIAYSCMFPVIDLIQLHTYIYTNKPKANLSYIPHQKQEFCLSYFICPKMSKQAKRLYLHIFLPITWR